MAWPRGDRCRARSGLAAAARAEDARRAGFAPVGDGAGAGAPAARPPRGRDVRYPGLGPDPVAARYTDAFGPILSFDVADGAAADRVERSLALIENATSLGGTATTLEGRYRWEGDRVPPGLLRISAGLEAVDDLWADLSQALDAAR